MLNKLMLVVVLLCAGCATNIGRAMSTAFRGTPPEVVESVQFVNKSMKRELREKYEAIEAASVTNADGSINRIAAENRFRDMAFYHMEMERWDTLCEGLATFIGAKIEDPDTASEKAADKRRKELWSSLLKGTKGLADQLKEKIDDPARAGNP